MWQLAINEFLINTDIWKREELFTKKTNAFDSLDSSPGNEWILKVWLIIPNKWIICDCNCSTGEVRLRVNIP